MGGGWFLVVTVPLPAMPGPGSSVRGIVGLSGLDEHAPAIYGSALERIAQAQRAVAEGGKGI